MATKTDTSTKMRKIKVLKFTGIAVYFLALMVCILLFIVEPSGFDARAILLPCVSLLFIGALGFSHAITSSVQNKMVAWIGTVLLAIMFTFLGFFVIAGVAWMLAVSHT